METIRYIMPSIREDDVSSEIGHIEMVLLEPGNMLYKELGQSLDKVDPNFLRYGSPIIGIDVDSWEGKLDHTDDDKQNQLTIAALACDFLSFRKFLTDEHNVRGVDLGFIPGIGGHTNEEMLKAAKLLGGIDLGDGNLVIPINNLLSERTEKRLKSALYFSKRRLRERYNIDFQVQE